MPVTLAGVTVKDDTLTIRDWWVATGTERLSGMTRTGSHAGSSAT